MKQDWDPNRLDVRAFAREAGHLQGRSALSAWSRLAQDAVPMGEHGQEHATDDDTVSWSLTGRTEAVTGGADQVWLSVQAEVTLPMTCQRCLTPVRCPVSVSRDFRFVADENLAAQEDEDAEEDVLVWSARFDALALIEDELIMALPMIPMHEACESEQVPTSDATPEPEGERPNPFAVLSKLRADSSK
jgi:uncharacterized protein